MQQIVVTVRSLKRGQRFKLDPADRFYYIRGPYDRRYAMFECLVFGKHKPFVDLWRYLPGATLAYIMNEGEEV